MERLLDGPPTSVSRRGFMKGAILGGIGALALTPQAFARALLSGRSPEEVRGVGVPKGVVRLSFNENPLGPSPRAIEAVAKHLYETNRYKWPEDLSFKLNVKNGVKFDDLDLKSREGRRAAWRRNRAYTAAGSSSILHAAAMAFLYDGGEVIEAQHGYGDVSEFAEQMQKKGRQVNIKRIPLTPDKRHDLNAMRKAITADTTLVVITNPNNPTGTIVSHEALEEFVDSVPKTVVVLVDEAYIHFVKDPTYQNAAHLGIERENVLVTRTFSKVYGMPGMRVGYALAHPKILEELWFYSGWNLSATGGYAASAALDDEDHVRRSKEVVWEGREYLYQEFKALGLSYTPTESNFVLVDVKTDARPLVQKLAQRKVFVRDAREWGVKNHIRVSFGTMEENEAFITVLRQVMS